MVTSNEQPTSLEIEDGILLQNAVTRVMSRADQHIGVERRIGRLFTHRPTPPSKQVHKSKQ
jgi:hypothetical protein